MEDIAVEDIAALALHAPGVFSAERFTEPVHIFRDGSACLVRNGVAIAKLHQTCVEGRAAWSFDLADGRMVAVDTFRRLAVADDGEDFSDWLLSDVRDSAGKSAKHPYLIHVNKSSAPAGAMPDPVQMIETRAERYGRLHARALQVADCLHEHDRDEARLIGALRNCGEYLLFRVWPDLGEQRYMGTRTCNVALLCPLCAMRRAAKQLAKQSPRVAAVARTEGFRLWLVTLTVRDDECLAERFRNLTASWRRYTHHRRQYLAGVRGFGHVQVCNAQGGYCSVEVKRGANSGQWHPHLHAVWLTNEDIDAQRLSDEWQRITGDSFIVHAVEFNASKALTAGAPDWLVDDLLASDLAEVCKYALKFNSMEIADQLHAWRTLRGRRLSWTFGCMYGQQWEEVGDLADDPLSAPEARAIDYLARYCGDASYSWSKLREFNGTNESRPLSYAS